MTFEREPHLVLKPNNIRIPGPGIPLRPGGWRS